MVVRPTNHGVQEFDMFMWPGRPGHVGWVLCGPGHVASAGVPFVCCKGMGGESGWLMFEEVSDGSDFFAVRGWGSVKEFICLF